jgi:HD-like signal output (HDOD) protein
MIADLVQTPGSATTAEDIVRLVKHLPSAPRVLPRLKRLLSDGNSSVHEIVELVRLDPGIAARVLQVANSVHFNKGVGSVTVSEAVRRIGYDQIYEVVSYSVASQVLVRPLEVYGIDADECWRRSVVCALAADALAARTGQDRDVAYTIGLLHSIGMVAIDEWALITGQHIRIESSGYPHETAPAEQEILGFTHAETGGLLLQHWEFPTSMFEPVQCQYAPFEAVEAVRMAGLLLVAKWVRSRVCSAPGTPMPPAPDARYLALVGLEGIRLESVVTHVAKRLAEVSSLLETGKQSTDSRNLFPSAKWRP